MPNHVALNLLMSMIGPRGMFRYPDDFVKTH